MGAVQKKIVKSIERWVGRVSLRLVIFIISILPLSLVYRLGALLGNVSFLLIRRHREQTTRNLRLAYKEKKSQSEIRWMARQIFRFYARCICEIAYFYSHKLKEKAANLINVVEGEQYLKEALRKRKGVIALGAHLGNFMLLGYKLSSLGYSNTTIMRQIRDEKLDEMFRKLREDIDQDYIPKLPTQRSVKESLKWLKGGGILTLFMDQRSGQGVRVDFFGIPTLTATGAAVLALRTGAPVLPIFIVRSDDGFYKLIIDRPIEIDRSGDLERDVKINTAKFTKVIEGYIRKYPTQWFWLHRRWKGIDERVVGA